MEYYRELLNANEDNVCMLLDISECKYLGLFEVFSQVLKTINGRDYIINNFDTIIDKVNDLDSFIFLCYRSFLDDKKFIEYIAHHRRMDIRSRFMLNVSECEKRKLRDYYPNISDFLVNRDDKGNIVEIIDEDILSTITANILDRAYDRELFRELKEFILINYKYNHLLNKIHIIDRDNNTNDLFHVYEEITSDIERLYRTSSNYKLEFLSQCRELVPECIKENMDKLLDAFKDRREIIEEIFANDLGDIFTHYINMFASISDNPIISSGESGTVCWTFIAGDFLIKYITSSHSVYGPDYEVPRCFLINKPYREIKSHNNNGFFLGKLEVQARLYEPLREDQKDIFELFEKELEKLGFFCDDLTPCNGKYNVYRLRDYHDADTEDPESLPDWFKENPYVLVDRDCIYPIEKREEVEKKHNEAEQFIRKLQNRL